MSTQLAERSGDLLVRPRELAECRSVAAHRVRQRSRMQVLDQGDAIVDVVVGQPGEQQDRRADMSGVW
ncbi:MAG TPA: hypothetical protein VFT22_28770 [Kofleriaceae bacterium]|nr:hypothetical protein [Kofleriaceae bacterium]